MKFFIDMSLSPELVLWLREKGYDAIHACEVGLGRASDIQILEHAFKEGRIVVTCDLDYPRLLFLFNFEGPGLILFRGGNYSTKEVIKKMSHMLEIISENEIINSIIVIEKDKIRRKCLYIENNKDETR